MLDVLAPVLGAIVTVYGLVAGTSSLLQARQMVRRGASGDVSLSFLGLYAGGYGLWLLYGLIIDSLPLVVVDAVGLLCGAVTLALALRLRRRAPASDGQPVDLAQRATGVGRAAAARVNREVRVVDSPTGVPVRPTAPSRWRAVARPGQKAGARSTTGGRGGPGSGFAAPLTPRGPLHQLTQPRILRRGCRGRRTHRPAGVVTGW